MADAAAPTPGRIFVSYRREDTAYAAGWLYDRLANRYGDGQIFKDVDSIELGDDFVEVITRAVGSCDVLLALVGEEWLTIIDEDGRRRLDDPDDFVRVEIEAALTRNVRVIPILVDGARMPRADKLPASLAGLVRRQALELSPARFEYDTSRLLTVLDRTLAEVRTAHDDAAAQALNALDPSTSELPKLPERARDRGETAEPAREQEARDSSLAPAGPSLQTQPGGEQLSTATSALKADAGTSVAASKVEGVQGAAADHAGLASTSGGPGPAARLRRWGWAVAAALIAVIAVVLVVVGQISGSEEPDVVVQDSGSDVGQISGSGSDVLLASFETGTEGWQPNRNTPDAGHTSQASDFATDGTFSLGIDNANTDPGAFYGATFFEDPKDIPDASAVSVDMKTMESRTQTAIAVQFGDRSEFWCQSPEPWDVAEAGTNLTVTLNLDLGTMSCPQGKPPPSELTELQAVWVWFDGNGSFRIDNVRVE